MYLNVSKKDESKLRSLIKNDHMCELIHQDTGIAYCDLMYLILNAYVVRGIENGRVLDVAHLEGSSVVYND